MEATLAVLRADKVLHTEPASGWLGRGEATGQQCTPYSKLFQGDTPYSIPYTV